LNTSWIGVGIKRSEIQVIEDIEEIETQINVRVLSQEPPTSQTKLLRKSHVNIEISRSAKDISTNCRGISNRIEALTGVPVLINTSFNVKGEPIVETPRDAVICFLTTGIDNLVLHDTLVSKNALHTVVAPLVGMYTDIATMVLSSTRQA